MDATRESGEAECRADFRLVKVRDGAAHPFEVVSGGDGKPVVVTSVDEVTGKPTGQVVTYEPSQL